MRNPWIAAVAAMALLAGCSPPDQDASRQPTATANIAPASRVTGSVTLREPTAIGAGAKLDVQLVDVAQPELALAHQNLGVSGMPPFNFALDFDPSRLQASRTYVVEVTLQDGPRRYVQALNAPVLTHGAGSTANVVLNPEPTAAELAVAECTHIEKRIGGMKMVAGTYTTDDSSVGWDGFAQTGSVRYVRVNTDFDSGAHSSAHYAFDGGRPLCVKQPGTVKARWNVGWNEAGEVLFAVKADGSELEQADIDAMRSAAEKALKMAQAKVDASRKK